MRWKRDKESLKEAREVIIEALSNSNIELADKVELMINLDKFLSEPRYEENVKVLKIHRKQKN